MPCFLLAKMPWKNYCISEIEIELILGWCHNLLIQEIFFNIYCIGDEFK